MNSIMVEIEKVRKELNDLVLLNEQITSNEIIQLSQHLDGLIKIYYC